MAAEQRSEIQTGSRGAGELNYPFNQVRLDTQTASSQSTQVETSLINQQAVASVSTDQEQLSAAQVIRREAKIAAEIVAIAIPTIAMFYGQEVAGVVGERASTLTKKVLAKFQQSEALAEAGDTVRTDIPLDKQEGTQTGFTNVTVLESALDTFMAKMNPLKPEKAPTEKDQSLASYLAFTVPMVASVAALGEIPGGILGAGIGITACVLIETGQIKRVGEMKNTLEKLAVLPGMGIERASDTIVGVMNAISKGIVDRTPMLDYPNSDYSENLFKIEQMIESGQAVVADPGRRHATIISLNVDHNSQSSMHSSQMK